MKAMITAAVLLSSCATTSTPSPFENPENYEGRSVRVCGFVTSGFEDGNIWASRETAWRDLPLDRSPTGGLALVAGYLEASRRFDHLNGRVTCLSGVIIRTGCGDENICNWTPFRYGLRAAVGRRMR